MMDKKTNQDIRIHNRRTVVKDEVIMQQGEKGNLAYLIQSGRVRVYTEKRGRKIELGEVGSGQIIGDMALVIDAPRSATIVALEKTTLVIITRKTFAEKLEKSDPTIRAIVPMLMRRISRGNEMASGEGGDVAAMIEAVNMIYNDMAENLPAVQKKTLKKSVAPKLKEFIDAISRFNERYGS